MRRQRRVGWIIFALLMAVSFAEFISPRFAPTFVSVYYVPNALLLIGFIRARNALEACLAAAIFLICASSWVLAGETRLALTAPFLMIDLAETGLLALAIRYVSFGPPAIRTPRDVAVVLCLMCAVGALGGLASALYPMTPVNVVALDAELNLRAAREWAFGDITAFLTIVAPWLALRRISPRRAMRHLAARKGEAAVALGAMALAVGYDFSVPETFGLLPPKTGAVHPALLFLTFPMLLWLSGRFGFRGATLAIVLTAVPGVQLAAAGYGPFWLRDEADKVLVLQAYVAISALTALVVATLSRAQHRREKQRQRALAMARRHALLSVDFLTRITHELRTPLNAVCGLSNVLASAPEIDPAKVRLFGGEIAKSGAELLRLVDEALDISAMRRGAFDLSLSEISVNAAIEDAVAPYQGALAAADAVLTVDAPESLKALGDAQALTHALRHVIGNAVTHGVAGGRVAIVARRDSRGVRLEISDDGAGFDPNPREGDALYRKTTHGAGVGLRLVEALIAAQGGVFRIDSAPGAGARAVIVLRPARAD